MRYGRYHWLTASGSQHFVLRSRIQCFNAMPESAMPMLCYAMAVLWYIPRYTIHLLLARPVTT
jgi:hypothetical protein